MTAAHLRSAAWRSEPVYGGNRSAADLQRPKRDRVSCAESACFAVLHAMKDVPAGTSLPAATAL